MTSKLSFTKSGLMIILEQYGLAVIKSAIIYLSFCINPNYTHKLNLEVEIGRSHSEFLMLGFHKYNTLDLHLWNKNMPSQKPALLNPSKGISKLETWVNV